MKVTKRERLRWLKAHERLISEANIKPVFFNNSKETVKKISELGESMMGDGLYSDTNQPRELIMSVFVLIKELRNYKD